MLDGWHHGDELELSAAMSGVTLDIVGRALFGADTSEDAVVMSEAITAFMDRFEKLMTSWIPLPIAWPLPGNRGAHRAVRQLDRIVESMVTRRKADGPGDDLLWWLLEARDERGAVDHRQLRDELVTLLLAGHETTALALSWTLLLLSRTPEAERKLVDELTTVLDGHPPSGDDVPRLVYTKQVVEESMRLRPPVWAIGREALADIELGGQVIDKGTQIFIMQWVVHQDPRFFPIPSASTPIAGRPRAATPSLRTRAFRSAPARASASAPTSQCWRRCCCSRPSCSASTSR